MQNTPILKFEKSTNYLNEQLDIQSNNKQLVSDIISNIGLFLVQVSEEDYQNYLNIQNSANIFLQTISQNITEIEELSREIKHITYDLTEVLSEANRKEKSKEYYISTISSVKNNIENYTLKFQNLEQKLEKDNIDFNEFININNIKYNFESNKNTNSYEFSGFTIDDKTMENPVIEVEKAETVEETEVSKKDAKIDELTNEFKSMLSNLSEDAVLSLDLITSLKNEFQTPENSTTEEIFEDIKKPIIEEDIIENSETSVNNTVANEPSKISEKAEPSDETKEDSNIIIDYSSIYGNYYKNASSIEENIFNEYSTFTTSNNSNNNETKKALFVLEDDEPEIVDNKEKNEIDNLEITDDDLLEELLKEELSENNVPVSEEATINVDIIENLEKSANNMLANEQTKDLEKTEPSEETKEASNEELLASLTDDELLAELLISEETSKDINSEKVSNESHELPIVEEDKYQKQEISKPIKINYNNFSNYNLEEKIKIIKEATSDNDSLIISEKQDKIFLPYTIDELEKYLKSYPDVYTSLVDVVNQEFILPFNSFLKHPAKARFVETYNLIKNRQGKSIFSAVAYGLKLLGRYNLNPAIIAACKTENQLDAYLYYLNSNNLSKFKNFKIIYEINPL